MLCSQSSRCRHSIHNGHLQIHQHNTRLVCPNHFERFFAVASFAHDLKILMNRKKGAQTFAEQRLIIDEKYGYRVHTGSSTSSINPSPLFVSNRTFPPSNCARSRRPSSPNPSVRLLLPSPLSRTFSRTALSSL